MKFIKEIMNRKPQQPDTVNIEDVAAMIDDAELEDPSNAERFNNLAAIQSKLKGVQSDTKKDNDMDSKTSPDTEKSGAQSSDQVSDFVDLVAEIKPEITNEEITGSQRATDDPDAALAPVMTEEDYADLDEELAKLSEVLEQSATSDAPAETTKKDEEPEPSLEPNKVAVPAVEETPVGVEETTVGKVAEHEADRPSVFAAPPAAHSAAAKPAAFSLSAPLGVGSPPPAKPDINEKQAAIREILKSAPEPASEPEVEAKAEAEAKAEVEVEVEVETKAEAEVEANVEVAAKAELELEPEAKAEVEAEVEKNSAVPPPIAAAIIEVPAPAAGRTRRRAGRVKTRLLGFEHANGTQSDPFSAESEAPISNQVNFPVGWIVVVEGPGLGTAFAIFTGVSKIGRGEDQSVKLDFGDSSISRDNHAAIAYDNEQHVFYLGQGGKANLVRLNEKPMLSTEEIFNNDIIRIGETKLRFIALCDQDFNWDTAANDESNDAAIA